MISSRSMRSYRRAIRHQRIRSFLLAGLAMGILCSCSPALSQERADEQKRLSRLVDRLGASSFTARQQAERKLHEVGPKAIPALTRAARRDDAEVALRAERVLRHLLAEQFFKIRVHLTARPEKIAWNEPFTLTVSFENPTPYAAEIPLRPAIKGEAPLSDEADHIGRMLDVADFLFVTDPDGNDIDLHLVDIQEDPQVVLAVERRLNEGPGMILDGGEKHTLTLKAFNRGWARYRMLRRGTYTIQFSAEPENAPDEAPTRTVASNRLRVDVTKGVEHFIDPDERKLTCTLSREQDDLVFSVSNCYDRSVQVHTQIGGPSDRFAQFRWNRKIGRQEKIIHEGPTNQGKPGKSPPFVELLPGRSIVLLRKPIGDLADGILPAKLSKGTRMMIWGVYSNFYSRTLLNSPVRVNRALRRAGRDLPPRFVFTGSVSSEPVSVEIP